MRFRVLLRGEGFCSRSKELDSDVNGRVTELGFYTTRVVDAPNARRAGEIAIDQVHQEVGIRTDFAGQIGTVVVEEVKQVGWWFRRLHPPRGFTFVVQDHEESRS